MLRRDGLALFLVFALCGGCGHTASATGPAVIRAHATRTIVLHVARDAPSALALFDPVQERRWSPGWQPTFSDPGHEARAGSVFTTRGSKGDAIWLLDAYDRTAGLIRYVEVQPGRMLTRIDIAARPVEGGSAVVTVTYERTSLSLAGDADVAAFASHFTSQRLHWQRALNRAVEDPR